MYWRGHVGLSLLAYAPIAGVVLEAGEPELAVLGGILAVAFSTLPDADEVLPGPHRGPTHTIVFAFAAGTLVALVAAAIAAVAAPAVPPWTPSFVGTVVTVTLLSHVAGDAITPMGIQPFRPVSSFHFTFDLTPAKNPRVNYLFLIVGILAIVASVLRVA